MLYHTCGIVYVHSGTLRKRIVSTSGMPPDAANPGTAEMPKPNQGTHSTLGTRSMLGAQVSSKRESAPSYGFGSSTREHRERVFISQEHAALAIGDGRSPGPAVYPARPSIGPQVNGAIATAPQWAFGSDNRFSPPNKSTVDNPAPGHHDQRASIGPQVNGALQSAPVFSFGSSTRDHQQKVFVSEEVNKIRDYGKASAGPAGGRGELTKAVGKQVLSSGPSPYGSGGMGGRMRNASQPTWVFGSADRFEKSSSTGWVPGPGAYTDCQSVGEQIASHKPSKPRFGFGSSTREHAAKVFISAEHDKITGNRFAPGPGAYAVPSLTGKPIRTGTQHTGSSWGFGTSKRFSDAFKKDADPGPGHYII